MLKRLDTLVFRGMVRVDTIKRGMPLLLLVVLILAMGACKKKY